MEQSFIIDIKLKRLNCPFTWKMEDIIKNRNNLLESNDSRFEMVVDIEDNFPEFVLIWHLMLAYENAMSDKPENAMDSIHEAEQSLADIKKKETLKNVENVLEHILDATKCHVLKKLGKLTEVDKLLKNLQKLDETNINETESAMLNGCQCLAWSLYRTPQTFEAINFAKEAIQCEPTNGKWHYLLGKSYRSYRRRIQSLAKEPNQDETIAFQQAYKLSKTVLFGVSLARLYRESRNYEEAIKISKEIYDLEPTCCTVRLQLALGFIRAHEFVLAKHCLDYVAERIPNSIMYAHYMGIYEEKCNKNFKAALSYYQIAVDNSNYGAEWQYLECKQRIEPDWDPLEHLLEISKKYGSDSENTVQEINVQIGTYYLFKKRDILSACLCLTKAIELKPHARILKSHRLLFGQHCIVNIYNVLTKEIQFALQGGKIKQDDETIEVLENTLKLCNEYDKNLPSVPGESWRGSPRSQSSNRPRNRGRGISSHRGMGGRENRSMSTSTSRSPAGHYLPRGSGNVRNLSRGNSTERRRVMVESEELYSPSTSSFSRPRNLPEKYKSGFQKRDDLQKQSNAQTTESSRTKIYRPPHTFRNQKSPTFGVEQRDSFAKHRGRSESPEEAECLLVKTRNLKL